MNRIPTLVFFSVGLTVSTANAAVPITFLGGNFNYVYHLAGTDRYDGAYKLDVYGVNQDNSVSVGTLNANTNSFSGWTNLGGVVISDPSAVAWGSHRQVFALGTDMSLFENISDDNYNWSGWIYLGQPSGGICSAPSAVSWSPGRIDVFMLGCDNHLKHIWFQSGTSGWDDWGCCISTAPSAISIAASSLDVFAEDTSGAGNVWDAQWRSTSGLTWLNTGISGSYPPSGVFDLGRPTVISRAHTANNFLATRDYRDGSNWNYPSTSAPVTQYSIPHPISAGDYVIVYYLTSGGTISRQPVGHGIAWGTISENFSGYVFSGDPLPLATTSTLYVFAVSGQSLWYGIDTWGP